MLPCMNCLQLPRIACLPFLTSGVLMLHLRLVDWPFGKPRLGSMSIECMRDACFLPMGTLHDDDSGAITALAMSEVQITCLWEILDAQETWRVS